MRYLPIEANVRAGDCTLLVAEHDEKQVRVSLPALSPTMVEGTIGHHELLARTGSGGESISTSNP